MLLKYFTTEGLTEEQIKIVQEYEEQWKLYEKNPKYNFISKHSIPFREGMDKVLWDHIKDLIPVCEI